MNQTTNLNLPQWEENDPIKREAFNAAMAAIDAAITGKVSIETFTYTGTGTYGQDYAIEFQFQKRPEFFIVFGGRSFMFANGHRFIVAYRSASDKNALIITGEADWRGSMMTFHVLDSAAQQLNDAGFVYAAYGFHFN